MNRKNIAPMFLLLMAFMASSVLYAGTEDFDKAMHPILDKYLKIQGALAADKTDGVKRAAEQIVVLSDNVDTKTITGEHEPHYRDVPMKIKGAAQALAKQKDIGTIRETFKELSRPMAMWATMSKPKGVYVVYCSMAKSSWLQKDKAVRNPYYGQKMLRCGEIVGGDEHDKSQ